MATAGRKKGSLNKSSMTVRLAFHNLKFDGIAEWVKAFRQLDEELDNLPGTDIEQKNLRFALIKEKLAKLEKSMEFIYPKITGMDIGLSDILELEEATGTMKKVSTKPEDMSTDDLLAELEQNGPKAGT